MVTRFDRHNAKRTAKGSHSIVRVNMTIPRELLERFKAHLAGAPLSTAVAEMMAERLERKRP